MQQERRITLKDIATEAGCSVAVVSTVLNGAKGNTLVSPETRARIVEIAGRLNYHPNFASRSLKKSCSQTVGIYVQNGPWGNLSNSYEMQIFKGIEKAAAEKNYDLLLINLGAGGLPDVCSRKISEHRIDGVLLVHADVHASWIDDLLKVTSNVVAIDFNRPRPGLDIMMFDNAAAIRMGIAHFSSLGHRRVGFIGTCLAEPEEDAAQRLAAFPAALVSAGLEYDERLAFSGTCLAAPIDPRSQYCSLEGQYAAEYFLNMGEAAPTAVIAYNDLVAIEFIRVLQNRGVTVPTQISVLGIDDSERCLFVLPELTSIHHPLTEMGYEGTLRLIEKIQHNETAAQHKYFAPSITLRNSTGPLTK